MKYFLFLLKTLSILSCGDSEPEPFPIFHQPEQPPFYSKEDVRFEMKRPCNRYKENA